MLRKHKRSWPVMSLPFYHNQRVCSSTTDIVGFESHPDPSNPPAPCPQPMLVMHETSCGSGDVTIPTGRPPRCAETNSRREGNPITTKIIAIASVSPTHQYFASACIIVAVTLEAFVGKTDERCCHFTARWTEWEQELWPIDCTELQKYAGTTSRTSTDVEAALQDDYGTMKRAKTG